MIITYLLFQQLFFIQFLKIILCVTILQNMGNRNFCKIIFSLMCNHIYISVVERTRAGSFFYLILTLRCSFDDYK